MKYAALAIYAMIGSGVAMGVEKGHDRDLTYPVRALIVATWPIAVSALSTRALIKGTVK